jgi:Holliday junction DNA helicase RuvA
MIAYVSGPITYKNPAYVYIDCNGVGYHVNISLNTYAQVEKLDKVKLLTHLHVTDSGHTLYGFAENSERLLFAQLISVSGIGPNTARVILSYMPPDEVIRAIASEDERAISAVKGIGPKTAKRVILDLKDKVIKMAGDVTISSARIDNSVRQDALDGLLALGYPKATIEKHLKQVLASAIDIDNPGDVIKLVLKRMS